MNRLECVKYITAIVLKQTKKQKVNFIKCVMFTTVYNVWID